MPGHGLITLPRGAAERMVLLIYKTCSSCGKKIPIGKQCSCKRTKQKRAAEAGGRKPDKVTDPFYNSVAWQRKRAAVRARYLGIDVLELYRSGKVIPADMVHHIIPRRERPDLRLTDSNLIPLAGRTHETVEAIYRTNDAAKAEMQKELYAAIRYFEERYGSGTRAQHETGAQGAGDKGRAAGGS